MCTPYTEPGGHWCVSPQGPRQRQGSHVSKRGANGKISFGWLLRSNLHTITFIPFFLLKRFYFAEKGLVLGCLFLHGGPEIAQLLSFPLCRDGFLSFSWWT